MQTIETLDQAAAALAAAFPTAHVNVISDTGIEIYIGQPEDAFFIEQLTDEETRDLSGWETREGWGDATYPGTIHRTEVGREWKSRTEAVADATDYLHGEGH